MAIEMKDPYGGGQDTIELGRSTLPVRETYSASPSGMSANYSDAMSNAQQVFDALKQLSGTFKQMGEKNQALIDKEAIINADLGAAGGSMVANGGTGSLMSRNYPGAGSPDGAGFNPMGGGPSAEAQLVINSRRGEVEFTKRIATDPEIVALNANEALKTNPAEYQKALNARINAVLGEMGQGGQDSGNLRGYLGGASRAATTFSRAQGADAFGKAVEEAKKINEQSYNIHVANGAGQRSTQMAAVDAVQAMRVDPAKLYQYVAIENPQWNNNAVSSNGSTGLTQINDARWADIKAAMAKDGMGDIAARLTDRRDPKQNATAWAYEYSRNEKQAAAVLGRQPTTAESYLYWFQPATATKALQNKDASVSDIYSPATIEANPAVFKGVSTVGQMIDKVNRTMNADSGMHTQGRNVAAMPRQLINENTWRDNMTTTGYKWTDFKNSGVYGGTGQIDSRAISAVDQLSQHMGFKVGITSAHRSDSYNSSVAGSTHNHQTGDSLDISIKDPEQQRKAVTYLASIGARGIGTYGSHIHFDFGTGRPNQQKDVNTWSSGGLALQEVNAAVALGRQNAGNGNYYRQPGFQGKTASADPMELAIRDAANYGIPASRARELLVKNTVQGALDKAYSGDHNGAQADLGNFRNTFAALSDGERNELNRAHETIGNMAQHTYQREQQRAQQAADKAEGDFYKRAHEQADAGGPPLMPKRSEFPEGKQGELAFRSAMERGISINSPPEAVSNGNLIQATAELSAGPQAYVDKLFGQGKEDYRTLSLDKLRNRLTTSGQFTTSDVNKAMEAYEKVRTSLPESQGTAQAAAKHIYDESIKSMVYNSPMAVAIAKAEQIKFGDNVNPLSVQASLNQVKDRASAFFVQNYAALMEDAKRDPKFNGQALDGDTKLKLAQIALQNTQTVVANMSKAVEMTKGNMVKAAAPLQQVTDPTQFGQAVVEPQIKAELEKQGLVAENIRWNNFAIPQGAFTVMDKQTGQPVVEGGAIKMLTATGQPFYFRPEFNKAAAPNTPDQLTPAFNAGGQPQQAAAPQQPGNGRWEYTGPAPGMPDNFMTRTPGQNFANIAEMFKGIGSSGPGAPWLMDSPAQNFARFKQWVAQTGAPETMQSFMQWIAAKTSNPNNAPPEEAALPPKDQTRLQPG